MQGRLLLLDDDRALREVASAFLRSQRHQVDEASSLEQARAHLQARSYDLVLADLVLENGTGLDLLAEIKREGWPCDVIIMTGHGGVEAAVAAIRQGAYNFITKPLSMTRLGLDVAQALEKRRLEDDLARLSAPRRTGCGGLSGASPCMQAVFTLLERAATATSNVLLLGESGTGKEIAARAVHQYSPRRAEPFVAINCGALPADLLESELFGHVRGAFTGADRDRKGVFLQANGGTLFLDEVGAAPHRVQVGLLRALQERRVKPVGAEKDIEVDVRIVAATNTDLEEAMVEGHFRQDLYYRLAALVIRIPPLRERREDIPLLAAELMERAAAKVGRQVALSPRALERLVAHEWPGNVRELEHLLERASLLARGAVVSERDLGLTAPQRASVRTLEEVERAHILSVLSSCAGNKLRAARLLGIPRGTLYRKLVRYDIEGPAAMAEAPPSAGPPPAVVSGVHRPVGEH